MADDTLTSVRSAIDEAVRLGQQGRLTEAIAAFDEAARRFSGDPSPEARTGVAAAVLNKGLAHHALGDPRSAMEALDEVVERFGADEHPWVRGEVAIALQNKAVLLATAGRLDEAVAAFDQVVAHARDEDDPALRWRSAQALADKVDVLCDQRPTAAAQAVRELVSRFGDDRDRSIVDLTQETVTRCGTTLAEQGRTEDLVSVFGESIRVWSGFEDVTSRYRVAVAHYNRAVAFRDGGRTEEALAEFDGALALLREDDEPPLPAMVARILFNKGVVLYDIDRVEDAVACFTAVRQRFAESDDQQIAGWVARSSFNVARAQVRLGVLEEALTTWRSLAQADITGGAPMDQVAAAAQEEVDWIEAMRLRPGHVRSNAFERSLAALYGTWLDTGIDPESGEQVSREVAEEYIAVQRRLLHEYDEVNEAAHDAAVAVLWDFRDRGRPFGLLLRNFDLESYVAEGGEGRLLALGGQGPSTVETHLMRRLAPRLPLLGVSNPEHLLDRQLGFEADIMPRLEIAGEEWLDRVTDLVTHAALVVVAAHHLTPGLHAELEVIRAQLREKETVVVLTVPDSGLSDSIGAWFGVQQDALPRLSRHSPELAGFPLVITEAAIPWDVIEGVADAAQVLQAVSRAVFEERR
ncbi:tetratricopeptide repeat protein [Blastococcus deserti]|uniref:Tetratricopeptide repeat protein n=1 Tax=Blastococcus deserti TaxID=2259033 RepID=A0ABW4XE97_9ACTN